MNLYSFLRAVTKFPRPNEIWGDKVSNRWNLLTTYLYLKLCWTQFTAHFGVFIQLFNMMVAIGTLLVVTHTINYGIVIAIGVVGLIGAIWVGHITVLKDVMKLDASAANNQNPELMEILKLVREMRDKLKNDKRS